MRIKDFFTVPEGQKVTERHLRRVLTSSILSILLCMCCLISSTWAWFTVSIENTDNTISISLSEVEVTEGNSAVSNPQTLSAGSHVLIFKYQSGGIDDLGEYRPLYVLLTLTPVPVENDVSSAGSASEAADSTVSGEQSDLNQPGDPDNTQSEVQEQQKSEENKTESDPSVTEPVETKCWLELNAGNNYTVHVTIETAYDVTLSWTTSWLNPGTDISSVDNTTITLGTPDKGQTDSEEQNGNEGLTGDEGQTGNEGQTSETPVTTTEGDTPVQEEDPTAQEDTSVESDPAAD